MLRDDGPSPGEIKALREKGDSLGISGDAGLQLSALRAALVWYQHKQTPQALQEWMAALDEVLALGMQAEKLRGHYLALQDVEDPEDEDLRLHRGSLIHALTELDPSSKPHSERIPDAPPETLF